MAIGDSLTQANPGYRLYLYEMLRAGGHDVVMVGPKPEKAPDGASLNHAGYGGFTIGPGPSKGDEWTNGRGSIDANLEEILQTDADIILLLIGTNDFFNVGTLQPGYQPDREGAGRIAAVVDRIHRTQPKALVLVGSVMPVAWDASFARGLNTELPALLKDKANTWFVDTNGRSGFGPGDWSPDNLHPSEQGHRKLAKVWYEAIVERLGAQPAAILRPAAPDPRKFMEKSMKSAATVSHRSIEIPPSREYRAWVDGREVYVFNHLGYAGGTMSWIYLDLDGAVEIEVRPHRRVDGLRVLPRRQAVACAWDGTTAKVRIEKPGHYFLEWDGSLELPFFVIARSPESTPQAGPGGRVITFGPGEHRPGLIELKSGDALHLAAGAEVYGAIKAVGARDIRITGRGILRQSHLPFGGAAPEFNPLELVDCQDVLIEGPIFLDGCTWNIVLRNCDRVHIRQVTIFSERPFSTDGINPCDSRDILIEQCFARCKDDCVSIKGLQRGVPVEALRPIARITVRDCLFWSDNNNGLVVGTETWASEISAILFQRTDFIRVSGTCGDWAGAFAVQALADTRIHDITFEDIDVEYCSGNPFSVMFLDEVYGIPGERREKGGTISGVTFRKITFHQPPRRHSLILGRDELRRIEGVVFDAIRFGDSPVKTAEAMRLETNAHVGEIRWQAAGS